MTRFFAQWLGSAELTAFLLITLFGGVAVAGEPAPIACDADNRHGTEISWIENRLEAQREAINSDKLLMVLHVSGDFSKPTFT